jgi:hypothetical protein
MERHCTTLGGLLPPSSDILRVFALIRSSGNHHVLYGLLPPGLLIHILLGLLLFSSLLLPSSMYISSQYLVALPCLLKFFLG